MKPKTKNMKQVHGELVDRIVSQNSPNTRAWPAGKQWLVWLGLSLVCMALFLGKMGVLNDFTLLSHRMPPWAFLITAFLGSSLAAWEAISSSLPGRQTGKGYRLLSLVVLLALVFIPFIFFARGVEGLDLVTACRNGWGCIQGAVLAGLLPWIILGFMLSKNASFHPGWTGAWSGVSAFLLGTVTIQIHCPNWETGHMVFAHLLPVAFLTILTAFAGAFWFSRWKN